MYKSHLKRFLAYYNSNGIRSLIYKIYKKIVYRFYKKRLKSLQRYSSDSFIEKSLSKYPKIISSEKMIGRTYINLKVSIIIFLEGDKQELLRCIDSIIDKSTYDNYEIIVLGNYEIIDNDFSFGNLNKFNIKMLFYDKCNYSIVLNRTIREIKTEYVALLNSNIVIESPDWIEELITCFNFSNTGVAAPLKLSSDASYKQAYNKSQVSANNLLEVLAVTQGCLMIKSESFLECNGLNEYLSFKYSIIDLCLRLREKGKIILYQPNIIVIGQDDSRDEETVDLLDRALFWNSWEDRVEFRSFSIQNNLFIGETL
ncbi:glycosyltransferase family 2 protein [Paenibacillus anseongense]|uniref:glycosyltransferase family 2 protein n=1 Tax=Paenibacillus anseongense TaxID=2682845 RepID=UPI002DB7701D|nr:glycosyltransferase [Paenibacillus anseongense]MEC0264315.1 hypothetical protein [Paenibacillus anseongense]